MGRGAVGMEVRRAVVTLDDRDRAAGRSSVRSAQRLDRPRQVLEHEAHEDVVERIGRERQVEDVGLEELDVGQPASTRCAAAIDSGETSMEVKRASGLLRDERDRLRADAASGLEHPAARPDTGVVVQQLDQRAGLIVQAFALALVVAVDVRVGHAFPVNMSGPVPSATCCS